MTIKTLLDLEHAPEAARIRRNKIEHAHLHAEDGTVPGVTSRLLINHGLMTESVCVELGRQTAPATIAVGFINYLAEVVTTIAINLQQPDAVFIDMICAQIAGQSKLQLAKIMHGDVNLSGMRTNENGAVEDYDFRCDLGSKA